MPVSAPHGSWPSPFDAASVASGSHPVETARFVGDEIWWSERRPTEGGRTGVFARAADGTVRDLLPSPASVRSRVHEYGGGAWTATDSGDLFYVDSGSQRIFRRSGDGGVLALTPEAQGVSYGDLTLQRGRLLAVRETVGDRVVREIVEIPPANHGGRPENPRVLAGGSDFTAYPRLSPDGRCLSRLAWDHPQLPWDGTRLEVVALDEPGATPRVLLGGPTESLVQPEWIDARTLQVLSDRSGFWNPVRVGLDGGLDEGRPEQRDTGDALWNLGLTVQAFDPTSGTTLLRTTFGSDRLEVLGADGARRIVDLPFTWFEICDRRGDLALVRAGSASRAGGLWIVDLLRPGAELVRSDLETPPDPDWLPRPEELTIASAGREVHAVFFPPRSPTHAAPPGELPPLIALVHGGPTDHTQAAVDLSVAYYTSRGLAVVDVNYGGSTGYGRAYRERLRGQWGVVDVEDVEAVVRNLAEAGRVDGARLAVEGGSAGGWTVLGALVRGDVFACGVSRYGVADLEALQAATHDFERSYTDGLVGPFDEDPDLWRARSPLTDAASLRKPVLLLQGSEDAVVPPSQSEAFRDALVGAGVPHAYLLFEGEGHGFRSAETKRRVREAALSFYGQVFGFAADVPELTLWRPAPAAHPAQETS